MATLSECSVGVLDADANWLANVLQSYIANERSGHQPRLAQNLEAIADAQHQPSTGRKLANRLHNRRKFGIRSGRQKAPKAKATWNKDAITVFSTGQFDQQKLN